MIRDEDTDETWTRADLWHDLRVADCPCANPAKGECGCEENSESDPGDKEPIRVRYHVHPLYGRAHDTAGGECWCRPRVTEDGIAVHREEN